MKPHATALQELVRRIVAEVHPLRVVLFGSLARREASDESDIDVLVVMPEGTHRRHTAELLYQNLHGIGVPFDLIVATPSDLERHKAKAGLVYGRILKEGKTLYAA